MGIKEYPAFPQTPVLLEPHHQIIPEHSGFIFFYQSAEMQPVYSTAPANWAMKKL